MSISFEPRGNYGRLLEPEGNLIVHGAGQSHEAFANYVQAVGPNPPLMYMTYRGLRGLKQGSLDKLQAQLDEYKHLGIIPQFGLCMTKDGTPEEHYEHEVAAGKFDAELDTLVQWLVKLDRPVYLRIGYEFNGHWNGYERDSYIAAYRHVAQRLNDAGASRVAKCWCFAADGRDKEYQAWYPGDEWVDWWSIDLFSVEHLTAPHSEAFARDAAAAGFPVLIGESTPRRVGVEGGAESWARWFEPYFNYMGRFPAVKAFSYIDWEWSSYPMWSDWGDGRIEANETVWQHWNETMANPVFLHGAPEAWKKLKGAV